MPYILGYGFLSENAGFARKKSEEQQVWCLSDPVRKAISIMGDKLAAKKAVASFDISHWFPATTHSVQDIEEAEKAGQ